jgi:hypothetical protein
MKDQQMFRETLILLVHFFPFVNLGTALIFKVTLYSLLSPRLAEDTRCSVYRQAGTGEPALHNLGWLSAKNKFLWLNKG